MAEHPNAQLWRRAQEAFSRRDMDALRTLWADDIVYHVPGASPIAGDHKGLDAVLALFAKIVEMGIRIVDVHDVLASDDHVVALVRGTASRRGQQMSMNQANIYHVRDGKIAEAWLLPTDQLAFDEFFS